MEQRTHPSIWDPRPLIQSTHAVSNRDLHLSFKSTAVKPLLQSEAGKHSLHQDHFPVIVIRFLARRPDDNMGWHVVEKPGDNRSKLGR